MLSIRIWCWRRLDVFHLKMTLLGTWVNEVRLQPRVQWELSDGDTLTFGGQSTPGSPEFYFLFQKVKVRPLDFDAITIPKVVAETFEGMFSRQRRRLI